MARSVVLKRRAPKARANGAIRSYRAALAFLDSTVDIERLLRATYSPTLFNLSRMSRPLEQLGNPHRKLRAAHIAGTKGKGSTATMLASMLHGCGYKVGLYTSPHMVDLRERITVN